MSFDFPYGMPSNWSTTLTANAEFTNWLVDQGSLTARLKSFYNSFSVQVLGERWLSGENDEQKYYIREVLLIADQKARVYAHTQIPKACIEHNQTLTELGSQPLGEFLFKQGDLSRGPIEYAQINKNEPIYELAQQLTSKKMPEQLYARRSNFILNGQTLSVCEVFLTDSPLYTHDEL
ncbi:chorismate--pyruvate lyase family protein [Gayadomonas joobiniege]|uniref:chorismate--pyruvate lyase family protein n=1 Tax=Gayadomonas joobiniege TaxID=1234606 RepID=UPI000360BB8A|nr:chorismate lyase [Gayadomonas joobiniege]